MNKPLKYKIEIQLKRSTGAKLPPKEIYHYDSERTALYIFDQFGDNAERREIFEWDGEKYVKLKNIRVQLI